MIKSGDQVLQPFSCVVREEALGQYELELKHPLDYRVRGMAVGAPIIAQVPVPYWPSAPATDTYSQTFRVYSVEINTADRSMAIRARHISYDAAGVVLGGTADFKRKLISEVVTGVHAAVIGTTTITLESTINKRITADYRYRNMLEAVLDPDIGIARQTRAKVVRNNENIFIGNNDVVDRGVNIRHGKDLLGVRFTTDTDGIATRIIPLGKNADGETILLPEKYISSSRIGNYPKPITVTLEVPDAQVKVDTETPANSVTLEQVYTMMRDAVAEQWAHGVDLPGIQMDVDFIAIGDTEEYAQYRNLEQLRLFDTVKVTDTLHGFEVISQVTAYEYDCLAGRYNKVTIGDIYSLKMGGIGSWQLPNGGVPGFKLVPGSLGGDRIVNGSIGSLQIGQAAVQTAHIQEAAITRALIAEALILALKADAIDAVKARIRELVAGSITTDQLYADLATIAVAQLTTANIENANISWADITTLVAEIADITQANIGSADIDYAQIKDLVAGTAIIREGLGGKLLIDRLAVNEANIVSLGVGELLIQGTDGAFYRLTVDTEGNVITELRQIGNADVKDVSLNAGEKIIHGTITAELLNVQQIFAAEALIGAIKAHNLEAQSVGVNQINPQVYEIAAQNATGQQVVIELSNGAILDEENTSTVATLKVYHQGVDVTDNIPASAVRWERISSDTAGDATWNAAHIGMKSVTINAADIDFRGVLRCVMGGGDYPVPSYVDGDLILTGGDAADFSLTDGDLMYTGTQGYSVSNGDLNLSGVIGAFSIDVQMSNLKTSYISLTRQGIEAYGSGFVRIGSGGDLSLTAGAAMVSEADVVRFITDSFNIATKGDRELLRLEPDGLAVGADEISANRFVGPIVGIHDAGTVPWLGSIQASINDLPKYLNRDCTLTVPAGTYNEDVVITGFIGSLLRVTLASGVTVNGSIDINNCGNIELTGAADKTSVIFSRNTSHVVRAKAVGRFYMNNLRLSGKYRTSSVQGTSYALLADGVQGVVTNCVLEKVDICLLAVYGSSIYAAANTGGINGGTSPTSTANLDQAYRATTAASIFVAGTMPYAVNASSASGGQIIGLAASTPTEETVPPPPVPTTTVTKYSASLKAGAKIVDNGSATFATGHYLAQGLFTAAGKTNRLFGLWMLPAISNAANITKATLTVRRGATGGTTASVPFRLYYTTTDWSAINGESMVAASIRALYTDSGLQASLLKGQAYTFTLSGAALTALKNGTLKGFGMRDRMSADLDLYYMNLDDSITLEVTTT